MLFDCTLRKIHKTSKSTYSTSIYKVFEVIYVTIYFYFWSNYRSSLVEYLPFKGLCPADNDVSCNWYIVRNSLSIYVCFTSGIVIKSHLITFMLFYCSHSTTRISYNFYVEVVKITTRPYLQLTNYARTVKNLSLNLALSTNKWSR